MDAGRKLAGGSREAARDIVRYVGDEKFLELMRDFAGGGGDFLSGNFADADDVAVRGGYEDFVGGVEIFGAERVLDDCDSGFGGDFKEDAAGDAFEAAGA